MPAFYARVAFSGANAGTGALIVNVVHVECDVLTSPPNWQSIAGDINTWLGTLWRNTLTTSDNFNSLIVSDENYQGSTHGQGIINVALPGTRTPVDTKLDAALCAVASFKTATVRRYARGHTFMPPARDSGVCSAGGGIDQTSAYFIACRNWADAYAAGHTAGSTSYVPIIFSRHQQKLGLTPFTFPITGHQLGIKQHWLRSRSTAP